MVSSGNRTCLSRTDWIREVGNNLRTDGLGDKAQSRGRGEVLQGQKTGMRKTGVETSLPHRLG